MSEIIYVTICTTEESRVGLVIYGSPIDFAEDLLLLRSSSQGVAIGHGDRHFRVSGHAHLFWFDCTSFIDCDSRRKCPVGSAPGNCGWF